MNRLTTFMIAFFLFSIFSALQVETPEKQIAISSNVKTLISDNDDTISVIDKFCLDSLEESYYDYSNTNVNTDIASITEVKKTLISSIGAFIVLTLTHLCKKLFPSFYSDKIYKRKQKQNLTE